MTALLTDVQCDAIVVAAWNCSPALVTEMDRVAVRAAFAAGLARAPAVPREPTQAMLQAGMGAGGIRARQVWRAMYDAAPAQDQGAAGVAPRMNSEPGNPERDKRAMYRPSHQSESSDSATANPNPMPPAAAPAPERHLTRDEQQMLSRALRNSARRLSPEVEAAIPENRAELYEPAPAPVVDELVQRLRNLDYGAGLAHEDADALAALRAENARLTRERDDVRAMLQNTNADTARLAHIAYKYKWQVRDTCARAERAEARADRLAAALRELVGVLEIGAVMPETLGKFMWLRMDGAELTAARAALAQEDGK